MSKAALHRSVLPPTQRRQRPADHFVRAVAAHFLALANNRQGRPQNVADLWWPDDDEVPRLLRAATVPANTIDPQWAGSFASAAVSDFISSLPRSSAFSILRASSLVPGLVLPQAGSLKVPGIGEVPPASFIGELSAMPVLQGITTATAPLTHKKLAALIVWTRDLGESASNVELLMRTILQEAIGKGLDQVLLSDDPASASSPAGIFNGVAPLTPAAAGAGAMVTDLRALVEALDEDASDNLILLANKLQAASIRLAYPQGGVATIFSSPSMPVGTVALVDASAFVSTNGDVPLFDLSEQAALHMADPASAINDGTLAVPVSSLWQMALVGFRVILDVDWTMRSSNHVAWMQGVSW